MGGYFMGAFILLKTVRIVFAISDSTEKDNKVAR